MPLSNRCLKKKGGIELNIKKYGPVSNLKFLSKIIEGVFIEQLNKHLDKHSLHDPRQFAYKQVNPFLKKKRFICD